MAFTGDHAEPAMDENGSRRNLQTMRLSGLVNQFDFTGFPARIMIADGRHHFRLRRL